MLDKELLELNLQKELLSNKIKEKEELLNDAQKKAIDEALESVNSGRVYSHDAAMKKLKEKHPKYFK